MVSPGRLGTLPAVRLVNTAASSQVSAGSLRERSPALSGPRKSSTSPAKPAADRPHRSAAECSVPTALKLPDVEIAQARNLDVDGLAVRKSRTDADARHDAQDDWRVDFRGRRLVLSASAIW